MFTEVTSPSDTAFTVLYVQFRCAKTQLNWDVTKKPFVPQMLNTHNIKQQPCKRTRMRVDILHSSRPKGRERKMHRAVSHCSPLAPTDLPCAATCAARQLPRRHTHMAPPPSHCSPQHFLPMQAAIQPRR